MRCKKALIWWLITGKEHEALKDKEKKISAIMPLVETLFPGIDYYSISGFNSVLKTLVIPVLKKQFSELESAPEESIASKETVEITEFLRSKGYEWEDSQKWKKKFDKLLDAA